MSISVLARWRRDRFESEPGLPASIVARDLRFQIDVTAHGATRIGRFSIVDVTHPSRSPAAEALVVEALLNGFIRY